MTIEGPETGALIGGVAWPILRVVEVWPCYQYSRLAGRAWWGGLFNDLFSLPGIGWGEPIGGGVILSQTFEDQHRITRLKPGPFPTYGFPNGPVNFSICGNHNGPGAILVADCPEGATDGGDGAGGGIGVGPGHTTVPIVKNLTIEQVSAQPTYAGPAGEMCVFADYLLYNAGAVLEIWRHPTVTFHLRDSANPDEAPPQYDWTVSLRETSTLDWGVEYGTTLTGHEAAPQNTTNVDIEVTATVDTLPAAGRFTFDIHAVQTGAGGEGGEGGMGMPGMMGQDEYWYKQPYDLKIPYLMPDLGIPGHDVRLEANESNGYDVRYDYYLQDAHNTDASGFQVDLLTPTLGLFDTDDGGSSGKRANLPHLDRKLCTLSATDCQTHPGVWRVVFKATDGNGGVLSEAALRRNGENKRMLAVNQQFYLGPEGAFVIDGPRAAARATALCAARRTRVAPSHAGLRWPWRGFGR